MATSRGGGMIGTTQFNNQKLQEEAPMFSKNQISFSPKTPLTHLVAANNNVVMAMANQTLTRINRDRGEQGQPREENISLDLKSGAKISSLFLDPTGTHLLIAVKAEEPELLYLHRKWTKPKQCKGFKGTLVTSVGWNYDHNEDHDTGPILLGTSMGLLVETEITTSAGYGIVDDVLNYKNNMIDLGEGKHTPITGVQFHQVPGESKYIVMATTSSSSSSRLYQFHGHVQTSTLLNIENRPLLQQVFNKSLNNTNKRFVELPSSLKYSTLSFHFFKTASKLFPSQFGWMTEPGIYWGRIDPSLGEQNDLDSFTIDCDMIPTDGDDQEAPPKYAFITEYHVLILYKNRLRVICLLNKQDVFDDHHDYMYGDLVGMAHDQMKNIYWVYTEYAVYKYQVVNEGRHVWRIYLEKGQYEMARRCCGDDPEAIDMILTQQAEKLYSEGRWEESAEHYAETKASFEEVTLRFMDLEDKNALKNYLKKKLEKLKPSEKTQITLIVIWLIEIYQNQLGMLRTKDGIISTENQARTATLEQEFLSLLDQYYLGGKPYDCIKNNKEVVYNLLGSHGDTRSLLFLAGLLQDTDKCIQYNLSIKDYTSVLTILNSENSPELVYKYCPVLIQAEPERTVNNLLIKQGRNLNPTKLLPAFLTNQSDPIFGKECIKYLEFAVDHKHLKCNDEAVHNLLLSLYIEHDPSKVENYLKNESKDSNIQMSCDTKFALKQCVEAGLVREAVHLYSVLGQHEQALELALTLDVDLAAEVAAQRDLPEDLSKKLWLMVAKHVVQEKNDIKQAMDFLKQCPSVKIEDILPFFPDFVTIDHFKDAICDSLQKYSEDILKLKDEMREASVSSDTIRKEIVEVKSEYQFIRADDRCDICCDLLMSRPFYIFSCTHKFHADCLAEAIMPHLPQPRQKKLVELRSLVETLSRQTDVTSLDSRAAMPSKLDQAQAELDDLIAGECLFCGDIMVKNIDKLFIEDSDFNRQMAEWM